MKKFFWAKHLETASGKGKTNLQKPPFWMRLALKKVGSSIQIPQRKFMELTPELQQEIKETLQKYLQTIINQ